MKFFNEFHSAVLMMMKSACLVWAGEVEKSKQSGVGVGVGVSCNPLLTHFWPRMWLMSTNNTKDSTVNLQSNVFEGSNLNMPLEPKNVIAIS